MSKIGAVFLMILTSLIFLGTCVSKHDLRGDQYIGSGQCKDCHKEIYDEYVHAAHFNTSSNQLPESVKANFETGKNVFKFNDSIEVVMERLNDRFYQSYFLNGKK